MKKTSFIALIFALLLGACSPFSIVSSTGEQPKPVIEEYTSIVPEQPVVEKTEPASVGGTAEGYTPASIQNVDVEVGNKAPISILVHVNLDLPDSCAQVEHVRTIQDGATFFIKIGTSPSQAEGCIQDTLPFQINIPLNALDLHTGLYTVDVNGVTQTFKLETVPDTFDLHTADWPTYFDDVRVDDIRIEAGYGSPLPLKAVIVASLLKSCGQLGEVQMHREGSIFYIRLIAELPAQTECNNDPLPVQLELPLNISGLPEGMYIVNVNGVETIFDLPITQP